MFFRSLTIFCVLGVLDCSAVRSKRSGSFEVTAADTGLDHDVDDFFASSELPDSSEDDDQVPRTKAEMTNQVINTIRTKYLINIQNFETMRNNIGRHHKITV